MTYVKHGQKELKTSYIADTPEVNKVMNLVPQDGSTVSKKEKVGIE